MSKNKKQPWTSSNMIMPTDIMGKGANTKYNLSRGPLESQADALAREQGTLDAAGNILGRFAGRTLLSVAELAALPYSIIKSIQDRSLASLFDNDVTKALENVNKSLVDNTPFYNSDAETNASLFSTDYLSSAGFWGNFIGEGGGFLAGAALGGGIIGKGLKYGAKAIGAVSKLSKGLAVASESATEINALKEAAKAGTLPDKLGKLLKWNSFKNATQVKTQMTLANIYEAGVEARGIKEEYINHKVEELKQIYGENYKPTELQLQQFGEEANTYANVGFIANMALLQIDGIGMSKLFSSYKSTKRTIDALQKEGKYISRTGWKKGLENIANYTGGAFKEAAQEGGQFITEQTLTNKKLNEKKASENSIADYYKAMVEAGINTFGSKEGQESMLIGFLLGAPNSVIEGREQTSFNKKGIELLNKNLTRDALLPILRNTNQTILNNQGDLTNDFAESNSKYAFTSARDKTFKDWIFSRVETGRYEDAISYLQALKGLSVEEFNKVWGTDFTQDKQQEVITHLIDTSKQINKLHEDVYSQYSKNPNKDMIVSNLAEGLLINKRIKSIQQELLQEQDNPLKRELLAADLGFLQKDKEYLNGILLALVAGENVDSDKNTIPTPPQVTVKEGDKQTEGVQVGTKDGKVIVDTPEGRKEVGEEDILKEGEGFTGDNSNIEVPEERDEDAPNEDLPNKSFVEDMENPDTSSFMDWTDLQATSNYEYLKRASSEKQTPEAKENAAKAKIIHDKIIDSKLPLKDNYTFSTKQEGDNTQIYAHPKEGGEPIKIGFFNNLETNKASEKGVPDNQKRSLFQFLQDYSNTPQGQNKDWKTINSLIQALNGVKNKVLDITNFLSLRSKIDNKPDGGTTNLSTILNSEYSERWKVNGEYLIAVNNRGTYEINDNVKKSSNQKLIASELKKLQESNKLNLLGTQYIILVKRPDSDSYQFIGLKGKSLADEEIDAIIQEIKDIKTNPNITPDNVGDYVATLNKRVFLATSERFINQNGEEVPIHIEFYNKKGTKDIVIWATKKIVGTEKDTTQKFGVNKTFRSGKAMEDIIKSSARVKIDKTEERSLEDLSKDLVTSTTPELWNTFLRFDHKAFNEIDNIPSQTEEVNKASEKPKRVRKKKESKVEEQTEPPKEETKDELDDFLDNLPPAGESNPTDDVVPFSISDDPNVYIEEQKIIENLSKITGFKVEFRNYTDPTIKGEFRDNLIILNKAGFPLGTEYHEAFHAIFSILPKEERARVIKLAYEKLGLTVQEYRQVLDNYRDKISPELFAKVMTKDKIISIALEEKLAELFRKYMNGVKPPILNDFFSRLKRFIKELLGLTEEDPFNVLFERIQKGEFKNISTGGKTLGRFMRVPNATKTQSEELIDGIGNSFLNKADESFLALNPNIKDSPNDIKGYITYYIKQLQKSEKERVEALANRVKELKNTLTPEQYDIKVQRFKEYLKGYNSDRYPIYLELSDKLVNDLAKEITKKYSLTRVRNLEKAQEIEGEEDEDTPDVMYNKPEFESNPKDSSASQMLIKYFKQLYIIDGNKTQAISGVESQGLYNNLLFRLSNVNKKDYKTFLEINSSSGNTRFNKIMKRVLDLYTTDTLFKRNFDTAFDRSFATFYEFYSDVKKNSSELGVGRKNVGEYLNIQLEEWRKESAFKKITSSEDITEILSIKLEPNVFTDPEGIKAIENLKRKALTNEGNLVSDFLSKEDNKALLNKLANININYRLDLNDLTARNAKNKLMYSMMNNSWIIEKLKSYTLPDKEGKPKRVNWGVYVGTRFNNNKLDYSDLDPRSMFLTTFGMWNNRDSKSKQHNPHFFTKQIEAKSTNYIFEGKSYINIPFNEVKAILSAEVERQATTYNLAKENLLAKDVINLVKGYHYTGSKEETIELLNKFENGEIKRSTLPRAYQIHNIPLANNYKINEDFLTEENWNTFVNSMQKNIKEKLDTYQLDNEELSKMYGIKDVNNTLKDFLIDQYLNRMQILAHITPDLGQFKDYVDITKRAAGEAASGPNHGEGTFSFGIFEDIEFGNINSTDAQGIETIDERIERLKRLGRLSEYDNATDEVNSQMYLDWKLLNAYKMDDRAYINKFGRNDPNALLKVEKTVGYNDNYYIKSSVTVLTRYSTSYEVPEGTTIKRIVNGVEKTYIAFPDKHNGKYYLPEVGSELSWMNMNKMQTQGLSALFAASAIKKNVHSVSNSLSEDAYMPHTFNYEDYRLQQENPSGKIEIKDGSQMVQLIDAYFSENSIVRKNMDSLISKIKNLNYDIYGPELKVAINNEIYDPFIKHVQSATEGSALNDRLEEFFEVENGAFKNSVSLPIIKKKFEQYMMSYFSNKIALHKTSGNKTTLVTSQFKGAIEIDGESFSSYEIELMRNVPESKLYNPEKAARAISRELRWIPEDGGYAEAIVTEEYIQQFGLNISQFYNIKKGNPELFEQISKALVYRIPTQAQHSMLPIRIVDVLPSSYGSSIILPKEITAISGADYDVDSVFIHKPETFNDGKLKVFKNNNVDSRYASWKNNSIISDILDIKNESTIVPLKAELKSLQQQMKGLAKLENADEETVINLQSEIDILKLDIEKEKNKNLNETLDELFIKTGNSYFNRNVESEIIEGLKNNLLEERLKLLTSPEGASLINNPAKDFFKEIYEMFEGAGFPNPKTLAKKYLTYSGQDNMSNEYEKVATGSKAIGGSANMNKVFAFLQKNGIELNTNNLNKLSTLYPSLSFTVSDNMENDIILENINGQLVITGNTTRLKSDTLSNNVSITVDNAKDQTLIKFFLNDKNISEASTLAGLGFGMNRLALFLQQPISKKLSSILAISNSQVYEATAYQDNAEKIEKYLKTLREKGAQQIEITDELLLSSVNTHERFIEVENILNKKTTSSELDLQYSVGLLYLEISKITKDAYHINTILNFNKTIGSEVNDLFTLTGATETIEKVNSNGESRFSFQTHNITSNEYYSTVKSNSRDIESRVRKLMVGYSVPITKFVNVFMSASKKRTTKVGIDEDVIAVGVDATDKKFQASLTESLLNYISIQLLSEKLTFMKDPEVINGTKVLTAYKEAISFLPNYEIGNLMKEQKKNSKSPYPFARVTVESFSKSTPELEEAIMNSFEDMLVSSNPLVRNFAIELGKHVAAHDNYEYVASSLVSKLRSKRFSKLNEVYQDIENVILTGQDLFEYVRQVTGKKDEYLKQNFIKFFTLDKRKRKEFKEVDEGSVYYVDENEDKQPLLATTKDKGFYYEYGPNQKVFSPIALRKGDNLYTRAYSERPDGVKVLTYNLVEVPNKSYKIISKQLDYNDYIALLKNQDLFGVEEEYTEYQGEEVENNEEEESTNEISQSANQETSNIYSQLGNKTQSENVILPEDIDPEADNIGMKYTAAIDFWRKIVPEAMTLFNKSKPLIVAFRGNSKKTFLENYKSGSHTIGNPFNWQNEKGDRKQQGVTSTKKFIEWMITGNNFGNKDATEEYRQAIINDIKSGKIKKSPILYYEEKYYATHATALDYLINKYNWNTQESKSENNDTLKAEPKLVETSSDNFKYFGKYYTINLNSDGIPINVDGYKGKLKDMQKILDAYSENPNVDPQNDKPFRGDNILSNKKEELGPYELFPEVFANNGQKEALDLLRDFINSNKQEFTLVGRGGTGKTTIIKKIVSEFKGNVGGITVAHKAKKVLGRSIGKDKVATVASALAIKLDETTGKFQPDEFAREQGKVPIKRMDLIIVDEASMISPAIYKEIMELKKSSAKVIFMGDNAQLPPVGEEVDSPVFNLNNKYILTEKMRQAATSPIINIGSIVAENTESETPKLVVITNRINEFDERSKSLVQFVKNENTALNMFVEDFKNANNNPDFVKAITFNNERHNSPQSVKNLNTKIREKLWGKAAANQFNVGEMVTAYDTYSKDIGADSDQISVYNSDDLIVTQIEEHKNEKGSVSAYSNKLGTRSFDYEYDVIYLSLIDNEGDPILGGNVPVIANSSLDRYNKDLADLWNTDKQLAFALKNAFANIQYGYAITSHKAQGSTYTNTYVFEDNILGPSNGGSIISKNKSLYVAVSRPTTKLVMISNNNTDNNLDSQADDLLKAPKFSIVKEVKPGVSELFESNPELANAIYEALGFNKLNLFDINKNELIDYYKNSIKEFEKQLIEFLETGKGKWNDFYLNQFINSQEKAIKEIENTNFKNKISVLNKNLNLGKNISDKKGVGVIEYGEDYVLKEVSITTELKSLSVNNFSDRIHLPLELGIKNGKTYSVMTKAKGTPLVKEEKLKISDKNKIKMFEDLLFMENNNIQTDPSKANNFYYDENTGLHFIDLKVIDKVEGTADFLKYYLGDNIYKEYQNWKKTANTKLNTQITPQQKATAQQLYSQYLEQNPNGSVEGFKKFVNKEVSLPEDLLQAQEIDPSITPEAWSIMTEDDKINWFKCNKK